MSEPNYSPQRPYPNQVARILAGTGMIPLTNAECTKLSDEVDARDIRKRMFDAAVEYQAGFYNPALGIPQPPPALSDIKAGDPLNNLLDTYENETDAMIVYQQAGVPKLWYVDGTVTINDREAPNDPDKRKVLKVDEYCGDIISRRLPGQAKLVMSSKGDLAQFAWV